MNHYLTEKATASHWWDVPVPLLSGALTLGGIGWIVSGLPSLVGNPVAFVLIAAALLGGLSAPLWLSLRRRNRVRQAKAIAECIAKSGQTSMTFGAISRRTNLNDMEDRLKTLIEKGYLQNITLDTRWDTARFDGVQSFGETPRPVMDTGNAAFNETLQQIRALNDQIADPAVSRKIDRIEDLTGGMFKLMVSDPEKSKNARRFVSYYLPTTMKLLKSYDLLEEQRYQGENITASRKQIEAVLDTMIAAIERQQDKLFSADAMDVEAEITVLETMLSADGLTGQTGVLHI